MLKRFSKVCVLFCSMVIITGCATYKKSDALQIASAAGISDVRDAKVSGETETALTSSNSFQVAFNSTGTGVVTRNGLNLDSLGVGIAMSILSPHSNAARNSIFGWIPAELVGDQNAHEFYHGKIDEAVHKALQKDLETNVRVHNKAKYRKHESALLGEWSVKELNSAYFFANDDLGCPETESAVTKEDWLKRCLIGFSSFRDPDRESSNASEELQSHSIPFKNVHAFTAETGYTYTRLYFNRPETSRLNELELIQAISNRLPDFMFIYAAPQKVTVANDEKLQFPILFRSGKPMFFVASESE